MHQVLVPKLGQTMEEATIEKWHVKEGDQVKKGDILLEITTDKATLEVESYVEGTVRKILVAEGEVRPVNAVIALVGAPDEPLPTNLAELAQPPAARAKAAEVEPGEPKPAQVPAPAPEAVPGRIFASPRARRLAKEKRVNLALLKGSGPNGRIVEKDVLAYLAEVEKMRITPTALEIAYQHGLDVRHVQGTGTGGKVTKEDVERAIAAAKVSPAPVSPAPGPAAAPGETIPLTPMRRIVAERMSQSKREIPHFYLVAEVDMTAAAAYRQQLNAQGRVKVSFHDLIIKACGRALQEMPQMNVVWAGDRIRVNREINIGLAVAVEGGLLVPVVRNVDKLSLLGVAEASQALIQRARGKKLTPDEYTGGCLTISNLGMYDVDFFIPVINPGESAILGVGRIAEKPVVRNGGIHVRSMMSLTLAGDHRAVDGAVAAGFLKRVKELLENPESLA